MILKMCIHDIILLNFQPLINYLKELKDIFMLGKKEFQLYYAKECLFL